MKKQIKVNGTITLSGLEQGFKNKNGKVIKLKSFLKEGDWWELKSDKRVTVIILHDAVKKIANEAGISTDPEYKVLTQPVIENNYTYLIQVKITDSKGRSTVELGEASRHNLGSRGRNNPANMAQKRAFDRAVFTHLGITGLLGEDELIDEENKEMDKLSHDDQKKIVPLLNELFAATSKEALKAFSAKMTKIKEEYSPAQLDTLRGIYTKKLAVMQKSF